MAQAKLMEIEKIKNDFQLRKMSEENVQKRHQERMNMDRNQLLLQGKQGDARIDLARKAMEQRERMFGAGQQNRAAMADALNFKKNFEAELALRAKEGNLDQVLGEMVISNGPQIKQLANIGDPKGGNITIDGKLVPLSGILSMDPADKEWDADGTPSEEGWKKILLLGYRKIMATSTQLPGMSSLAGVFPEEEE